MALIIEGPDNAGKTTLAKQLSEVLRIPIHHPGGAPKGSEHELSCMVSQLELCSENIILDRVTCISQPIFNTHRHDAVDNPLFGTFLRRMIDTPGCVIIYCRPDDKEVLNMFKHEVKPHDSPAHIQYIEENQASFVKSYDLVMSLLPHIKYNYVNDVPDYVRINELLSNPEVWNKWRGLR